MTEEDKISRRYRELPREEPPRHVDDAILAASRRAVHTRPAPLVVPSGRQRWYFPLAAAAIIVLAVAVTMHMQVQQPAEEMVSSSTTSAPAETKEAAPSAPPPEAASRRGFQMRDETAAKRQPAAGERRERSEPAPRLDLQAPAPPPELQKSVEVAASAPAPSQDALRAQQSVGSVLGRVEPVPQAAPAPQAKAAAPRVQAAIAERSASAPKLSASVAQSPEQWLQGIADLRRQGYHDEADRQLAEFRKRYTDYRIPEAMLRKVERSR